MRSIWKAKNYTENGIQKKNAEILHQIKIGPEFVNLTNGIWFAIVWFVRIKA